MITLKKKNLNGPYYFCSDMINIKCFNPNLLSIDKISYTNTDVVVHSIKYIMIGSINNQNIDIKDPICLIKKKY